MMVKLTKAATPVCECGEHAFVNLTKGYVAFISPEDRFVVAGLGSWQAKPDGNTVYARTSVRRSHTVIMHRKIIGATKSEMIDHADGDGLNNRRSNLRKATSEQNQANRRCLNKHGYKGVSRVPKGKSRPWQAQIKVHGKQRSLGYFATSEEAARAYDVAAFQAHGEFAKLNFPAALADGGRDEQR